MDSEIDLSKFGFKTGEKVALADDDWSAVGRDIVIVDVEPVPGSTQCLIQVDNDFQTVSRSALRHI